jgi:peptide/nickel transport system substrate-binding protein
MRRSTASGLTLISLLVLAACTTPAAPSPPATTASTPAGASATTPPTAAQPLVIGYTEAPDTLYGFASSSAVLGHILQFVQPGCIAIRSYAMEPVCFETLPTLENGGIVSTTVTIRPDAISETTPVVIDGALVNDATALTEAIQLPQLTATWRLLDGISWQDGTPLTADDIVFTWELANHPDTPVASRYVLDRTARIEKIDDRSVRWVGVPGYLDATAGSNFVGGADSTYAIYPKHILGDLDPAAINDVWGEKPIGYGAFMVESYEPGEQITLVKNPHYWRASEGLPKVERVLIRFLSNADQLVTQLAAGDIDIAGTIGLTLNEAPLLDDLATQGKLVVQYVPGTVWEHLDFGIARGDGQPSFFDDLRVRQAFAYGINRQQIVDEVLGGRTSLMHTFQPPSYWAYPDAADLNTYPFDQARAAELLDEAGWTRGADGARVKDGRRLSMQLHTTEQNTTRQLVAQIIQENLRAIGFEVELRFVPGDGVLFAQGEEGILAGRRFDLALYAWQAGPEHSAYLYLCDEVPGQENDFAGQNYPGYCKPAFDEAVYASDQFLDRAGRAPLINEAQVIFNRELPALPLYQEVLIAAYRPGVEGVNIDGSAFVDFAQPELLDFQRP